MSILLIDWLFWGKAALAEMLHDRLFWGMVIGMMMGQALAAWDRTRTA